jgi:APA family basic amino acid/polyamine antiporter
MSFRKELGRFDTAMVVVGGIIGAGIFINPYIVAQRLDSSTLVMAAWLAGGAVALAGALTFAELGALFPQVGGQYAYLRDAYHPVAGFLYGWGLLLMIECGAIAAVGITFAEYTLRLVGRPDADAQLLTILAIVMVAGVNYVGVKPGSRLLNAFVILKLVPLALLIGAGLLLPIPEAGPAPAALVAPGPGAAVGPPGAGGAAGASFGGPFGPLFAFGAALIPVMFSYGGWQNANYVAEEMKDPVRDLPAGLMIGTGIVVTVYALVNMVYLRALGHAGLASTLTPASDAARVLFGGPGDFLVTLGIAVSTFGFLNLTMLAPTRVYYAMARDGLFPKKVAELHPRFDTPSVAIVVQTVWAVVLVLTGTYAQLVDYVVTVDWIFFGAAGATIFVFRRRLPVVERSDGIFRTPLYPVLPALFVAVAVLIVGSVLWTNPVRSGIGFALLVAGVPAYLYWSSARMSGGGGTDGPDGGGTGAGDGAGGSGGADGGGGQP